MYWFPCPFGDSALAASFSSGKLDLLAGEHHSFFHDWTGRRDSAGWTCRSNILLRLLDLSAFSVTISGRNNMSEHCLIPTSTVPDSVRAAV